MPKEMPKFRVFISDEEGNIDFKDEAFALWENCSQGGKIYYAGKLSDGRRVQMWPVQKKEGSSTGGDQAPEDVPF